MAGHGKKRKNTRGPFSQLKGFRVSESAKSGSPEKPSKEPPPSGDSGMDDEDLFFREMIRLGICPPGEGTSPGGQEDNGHPDKEMEKPAEQDEERELFLAQMGGLDVVFEDDIPDDEENVGPAVPRRMKQVRQGRLKPEGSLDLHGMDRNEARQRVRFFLEDMVWQGRKTVLIITGRGLGSGEGGPVLRTEAERFLSNEGRAWVLEWGRAPRRYGGDGALIAFLRSRPEAGKE